MRAQPAYEPPALSERETPLHVVSYEQWDHTSGGVWCWFARSSAYHTERSAATFADGLRKDANVRRIRMTVVA